ncbi:MAG: alkaline phosphatase [Pirellulaceae bacterium]|nr:MAG: alkaline phosphatase [Pirellulaceae bacterium]
MAVWYGSRRQFLQATCFATAATALQDQGWALASHGPYQATGVRVGEMTSHSAIVWTRLTGQPQRNQQGILFDRRNRSAPNAAQVPIDEIEGACPAAAGRVRLLYGAKADLSDARQLDWIDVADSDDGIHKFTVRDLVPDTTYYYAVQAALPGSDQVGSQLVGQFRTAPPEDAPSRVRFCVMTCQGYHDRDHAEGHPIYPSMIARQPHFLVLTGDLVYYDNDPPRATNVPLARLHWQRMFSLPRLRSALAQAGAYWLKDDHDTLSNDSWPGMTYGELTFAQGQELFQQQAPIGPVSYRTFRWGRDLQVWFSEGRDFRSPNRVKDGPEKTIWGAEQREWFQKTVLESDATWKILVSPTPLVGPDRPNKNDNHANAGFSYEGEQIRAWLKEHVPDNFFVVCGDRHWQYHSIHPRTGLHEFSVGAASDSHAGGSPGYNSDFHRFHRVAGGFLCVDVQSDRRQSQLAFQLRDVDGAVVHQAVFRSRVPR